jgi:hypothetical protein
MSNSGTKGNRGFACNRLVRPQLLRHHQTLLGIVDSSFWDALLYPLKVSIQNLSQGCPVPPGCQSEPEKECPRRQNDNANEVPVEQDNSGENRGRGGSQKRYDGAASQEDPP